MCIAFWSTEHPRYALPTLAAQFHAFGKDADDSQSVPPVLSGRDLQAGGTWLGINRSGRVALLTNITEPPASYTSSRGHLVSSFLLPEDSGEPSTFAENLTRGAHKKEFAGFNMLLFYPSISGSTFTYDARLVTNSGGGGAISSRPIDNSERRVGGVSNGVDSLGGAAWPKVQHGKESMESLLYVNPGASIDASESELVERLFDLLTWQSVAAPSNRLQLRQSIEIPPLRMTSSLASDALADGPEYYGTRLSTVVLIGRDGRVVFVERDIWQLDGKGGVTRGDPRNDRAYSFDLASTSSQE